jgi:hypothetical protein
MRIDIPASMIYLAVRPTALQIKPSENLIIIGARGVHSLLHVYSSFRELLLPEFI